MQGSGSRARFAGRRPSDGIAASAPYALVDNGEAEKFYRDLKARGISARVGMETTGYSRWFERLLAELGFEVWIGDAAEIKTRRAKKKKTDREDARLLLKLLLPKTGAF